jgi:hypothetical protein
MKTGSVIERESRAGLWIIVKGDEKIVETEHDL